MSTITAQSPFRRRAAFALPLVLMVLALLAIAFSTVIAVVAAHVGESRRLIGQNRAFYACDNAARLAASITERKLLANARDNPLEIADDIVTDLCTFGACDRSTEVFKPFAPGAVVACGPGCRGTCRLGKCEATVATVSYKHPVNNAGPFFLAGTDSVMEAFSLTIAPPIGAPKRIRLGAFAGSLASQSALAVSVGARDSLSGALCTRRESYTVGSINPAQFLVFSEVATLMPQNAAGFAVTPPAASAAPGFYVNGAIVAEPVAPPITSVSTSGTAFASVRVAQSPIHPSVTGAMQGRNRNGAPGALPASARFLVDPVVRCFATPAATCHKDSEALVATKLYGQADLRIVDGVWFKRIAGNNPAELDPDGVPKMPGRRIWSDHPGVLQVLAPSTLAELMPPLTGIGQRDIFSGSAPPLRFSAYDTFSSNDQLRANDTVPFNGQNVISYGANNRLTGTPPLTRATYVTGDGGSFTDAGQLVYPINIDVGALVQALSDNNGRELGGIFRGSGVPGARFNGILYITQPTDGSLRELVDSAPPGTPSVLAGGPQAGTDAAVPGGTKVPRPMCTSGALIGTQNVIGGNVHQACPTPEGSANLTPNAIRITNASNLSAFAGTGFTIATNLPVYVEGNFNTVGPPVRAMIAGDRVTFMPAGSTNPPLPVPPPITLVTVNALIATGANTVDVVPIEAHQHLRTINNAELNLRGSIYIYGYAVFDGRNNQSAVLRNFAYDDRFSSGEPQRVPPGLPSYPTDVTDRWADIR